MLLLKYLLLLTGWGLLAAAVTNVLKNLYQVVQYHRQLRPIAPGSLSGTSSGPEGASAGTPLTHGVAAEKPHLNWTIAQWAFPAAWLLLILAAGIVVVPSGMGGIRVSQTAGTRPGTLYPGAHLVTPLLDLVVLYDIRDQVLTTSSIANDGLGSVTESSAEKKDAAKKPDTFSVQSKEGLSIGLAITVRYRLDPRKLDFIHANLPQPVEKEIVPPVVSSVFRELAPNYTVREVFATKREEIRQSAADRITRKLAGDGIIVKEVMLRDVQLPEEYAKGLEGLLLKEQENEGLGVETEMKSKQVKIAELEAEAARVRQVKQAQGAGQVRVLQAKSEADAMQFTLPLKQKQIQQSKLEAEAQKETTVKNAEAMAQAKVIDSKAELERRNLLADAEAGRIRKVALADAERMKSEAALLKESPLLINKIVAERMSDKLQIMMVPSDAKIFFNDVFKSGVTPDALTNAKAAQAAAEESEGSGEEEEQPAPGQQQMTSRKSWKSK
ncbi:MAG TPA: SPFH domain-containing protein [Candidatus Angelobacter sp.]|jgi:regulator of protease activity HflC (stomatin/prohibitin superfamily)